jgi:hypothetical protein
MNTQDGPKEVQFRQGHCNLICFLGVGAGAESVILAEISRVTTNEITVNLSKLNLLEDIFCVHNRQVIFLSFLPLL